eukprot:CAMPEP_0197903922 /NCGR_PEP_ID=MMETSP1439-20131203/56961_1 /TAXON_ID=66791 /ORGANISM="Gonyaulax spinifera, Strain CCMP409" /LENGTH=195 /DNA_ID=CAMNT_0043525083 /DNA_START=38 /DNA_END=624 /DNA_ORIENTATION=+
MPGSQAPTASSAETSTLCRPAASVAGVLHADFAVSKFGNAVQGGDGVDDHELAGAQNEEIKDILCGSLLSNDFVQDDRRALIGLQPGLGLAPVSAELPHVHNKRQALSRLLSHTAIPPPPREKGPGESSSSSSSSSSGALHVAGVAEAPPASSPLVETPGGSDATRMVPAAAREAAGGREDLPGLCGSRSRARPP